MNLPFCAYLSIGISRLGIWAYVMTKSGFIIKAIIALIGCFAAAYVGQELLGGEALGFIVGGAILGVTAGPFLMTLLRWRKERDALRAKQP